MFELLRRSTTMRLLVVGAVALVSSGSQSSCVAKVGDGVGDGSGDGPTFTTTLLLRDAAGTANNTFQVGERITFELSVRNRTTQPVELQFASGQQYDFFAFEAGTSELAWLWSSTALFIQAETSLTFAAGETRVFEVTWAPGEPGTYEGRGAVLFDELATHRLAPHELGSTLVPFTVN